MRKMIFLFIFYSLNISCSKTDKPAPIIAPPPVIVLPAAVDYNSIITNECNFILRNQLSNGAFTMSANRGTQGYKIVPYFSNIAARALLENPTSVNIAAVKNWMVWYMTNLNADGSIYDYYSNNFTGSASLTSTGDFDSMDSYAATFLTLVRKLCEASPADKTWLTNSYSSELKKIGEAMFLVVESDGLSIAKPSYAIKYTMDNAEVNEGMTDMVWLSQNVITGGEAVRWQNLLSKNKTAIENDLWSISNGRYLMYKGGPVANWSLFYADATCQLFPIWCSVLAPESSRAVGLWATFNTNYPEWSTGKIYDAGGYPWTMISYVAAVMNDSSRANNYLRYVQLFTDIGKQPTANWYNLEAAFVILAAKKMK